MNKGYLIAHVTVTDPAAYAEYANAAGEALQGFNPGSSSGQGNMKISKGRRMNAMSFLSLIRMLRPNVFITVPGTWPPESCARGRQPGHLLWLKGLNPAPAAGRRQQICPAHTRLR